VPGIGAVYGATIAAEVGDVSRFDGPGRLASYAGVAPVREESGISVSRRRRRKGGNRRLKNAVIRSSECSVMLGGPARDYYDRKRAEGKSHRQAIRSLARRRIDLVYALLRDGTTYDPSTARV
jgi:transposase